MNLSHVYGIRANQDISATNSAPWLFVQTLVLSGDLSFTKRWNLSGNLNFNLQEGRLTNAYFSLNRNMHCWALSFYYVPIGGNKSYFPRCETRIQETAFVSVVFVLMRSCRTFPI